MGCEVPDKAFIPELLQVDLVLDCRGKLCPRCDQAGWRGSGLFLSVRASLLICDWERQAFS